jgi:hypothetical protein
MPFRRTRGIVTDSDASDPKTEADVIMTAAALGFAASHVKNGTSLRFDIDPKDQAKDFTGLQAVVAKIDKAVVDYLRNNNLEPAGKVNAGLAPDYSKGAVIMGVYKLANQSAPISVSDPVLSVKGQTLYEKIKNLQLTQYTGRGAYTGFVDNKNTEGNTEPVGPRPTARFLTADPDSVRADDPTMSGLHPRWLPRTGSASWIPRLRKGTTDSYVPWGMIGGDSAGKEPDARMANVTSATNLADQITGEMSATDKMVFNGNPTTADVVAYTHGMIQAIYKAYSLGPSCAPYEIAVGAVTTKMASCLPCTFFMVAQGYPPTSIHLGRGESWAPLYQSYNPGGPAESNELAVIRDLNNSWRAKCAEWLGLGLRMMDDAHVADDHKSARDALRSYLASHSADKTVAATLVLDAVTVHESESVRIGRTLK